MIRDSLFRIQVLRLLKRHLSLEREAKGRVFESTHFNGGVKGLMVENGQFCPGVQVSQASHRPSEMDPNTKTLVGPLMEMLEVVIAEQTISPLLKAYSAYGDCRADEEKSLRLGAWL